MTSGEQALLGVKPDKTKRRELQDRLWFQAQLLSSIRESVVATDLDGNVTYWNAGAEALYGYRADEVMGKSITLVVEPGQREEEENRLRQVHDTGSWAGEYVQRRKDGSGFWSDTLISLMVDERGEPCGYVGIDRDISGRKGLETALRAVRDGLQERVQLRTQQLRREQEELTVSRRRLLKAQRVARMGFLDWDLKTNTITWSREVYRMFGIEEGTRASPEATLARVHPDDLEFVQQRLDSAVQDMREYDIDHRIVRPDGTVVWVHARADLERDEDDEPAVLLGTLVDITDRKETAEALHEAEYRYRTVANFTYDWEWWQGPDDKFIYVSPSSLRVSGYAPEEFMDSSHMLRKIILPEDMRLWEEHAAAARTETGMREVRFRIRRKDGEVKWIEHVCQPVIGAGGEIQGFRASNRDTTERESLRQELERQTGEHAVLTLDYEDGARDPQPESRTLEELERSHILAVLNACNWKIKGKEQAAEVLGLNPSTLYSRMKKLGIANPYRDTPSM
jgi:PAS domain S-box-containing protein